ncbi:hypothetical protein [Piscinibacter koreensis]|uniref:Uncharacterized protein n=1 Tax=Piscinibacter koreensis TaxID=2742824 RepID=A0A7Y6TVM3_9BURK|nr:hypothetical protein [Schlegelella koreensis]NUZ05076.1 hypothetical protein [Schlegelella koreensis]
MSTTTYSPGSTPLGGSAGSGATSATGAATAAAAAAPAAATGASTTAASTAPSSAAKASPASAPIPAPATKIDDDSMSAADRIEASRERLRNAMQHIAHPAAKPAPTGTAGKALHVAQTAAQRVQTMPGASLLMATLERWWRRHPLHDAVVVAAEASRNAIVPYAQRNPNQLVLGSVALGAVLVILRPWRLLFRRRMLRALLPHFIATVAKQLPLASMALLASRLDATPPRTARRKPGPAGASSTAGSNRANASTTPGTGS